MSHRARVVALTAWMALGVGACVSTADVPVAAPPPGTPLAREVIMLSPWARPVREVPARTRVAVARICTQLSLDKAKGARVPYAVDAAFSTETFLGAMASRLDQSVEAQTLAKARVALDHDDVRSAIALADQVDGAPVDEVRTFLATPPPDDRLALVRALAAEVFGSDDARATAAAPVTAAARICGAALRDDDPARTAVRALEDGSGTAPADATLVFAYAWRSLSDATLRDVTNAIAGTGLREPLRKAFRDVVKERSDAAVAHISAAR